MNNKAIIKFGFRSRWDMKNSTDLRGCYPQRPKAEVDNSLFDLQNTSYPTQPHSIIANYSSGLFERMFSEKKCINIIRKMERY